MITRYKQSYLMVMESGKVVKWTGMAISKSHGEGLAVAYATTRTGEQVWDMCCRPVK